MLSGVPGHVLLRTADHRAVVDNHDTTRSWKVAVAFLIDHSGLQDFGGAGVFRVLRMGTRAILHPVSSEDEFI